VDTSQVQESAQQSDLSLATKRCNDLKAKLKASRDKESAAEDARQAAERQVLKAQDELEALQLQLSRTEAQAFAGLDQQLGLCKSSANLVREAVRVVEDLAARVEVKGRDLLARTGSAGWSARLGSMPRASRAPVPSDRPSALDPRLRGVGLRGQPAWAAEKPPARPAAGLQGKEVRLACCDFPYHTASRFRCTKGIPPVVRACSHDIKSRGAEQSRPCLRIRAPRPADSCPACRVRRRRGRSCSKPGWMARSAASRRKSMPSGTTRRTCGAARSCAPSSLLHREPTRPQHGPMVVQRRVARATVDPRKTQLEARLQVGRCTSLPFVERLHSVVL
jgi:hypothetical protein